MKEKKTQNAVLSVFVTPQLIEAVLMQKTGEQVQVLKRFIRPRAQKDSFGDAKDLAGALPGLKSRQEADYSLQVGESGNGLGDAGGLFMTSEFEGLGMKKKENAAASQAPGAERPAPFSAQLLDILNECTSAGYPAPDLAFQIAPPDVSYVELRPGKGDGSDEAAKKKDAKAKKDKKDEGKPGAQASRRSLLHLLSQEREAAFDKDRVAFLPMKASGRGEPHVLAVVPEEREPVGATLSIIEGQRKKTLSGRRVMDAELPVYARLARKVAPADRPGYTTAIVRVSSEETLVVFYEGEHLRHFERLRSLSTYDSPDTICSRVLLQQDEQKLGEMNHLIVISESQTDQLLDAFRSFYPDTVVESAADALTALSLQKPAESDVKFTPGSVPAIALGLRLLQHWDEEMPELEVHLLPKKLRKKKQLAIGWHTVAAALLLFGLAFFFTWRYMDGQEEIRQQREEMERNPVVLPVDDPDALKMRVDSLRMAYVMYSHALGVLDSLLVGSDKWSRVMEKAAGATGEIGRIWFTDWTPQGNEMWIEGHALVRSRVAELARSLEGRIERLDFADVNVPDVGDVRVYPFTMVIPIAHEMPQVALHLQAAAEAAGPGGTQEDSLAAADLYAPGQAPPEDEPH